VCVSLMRPTSSPDHSTLVSTISPDPSRMSAVTRLSLEGGQPRIRLEISRNGYTFVGVATAA
jgi:hypothetical protein